MINNKEVRISVNKTLTRKLIYVVAALTLLAMLIPAMAVPVSAAAPSLTMVLVDPITGVSQSTPDSGYNIRGSIVEVLSSNGAVAVNWALLPPDPLVAQFYPTTPTMPAVAVKVQGYLGNVTIEAADVTTNETASIGKKWGLIDSTAIRAPGSSYVIWNEAQKAWLADPVVITDTVTGVFAGGVKNEMQGAILEWYLLPGNVYVNMASEEWLDHDGILGLKSRFDALIAANKTQLVSFDPWTLPLNPAQLVNQYKYNITDKDGKNSVTLYAKGEEAVQVVCVARYPGNPQIPLIVEKTSWAFFTTESEVVPQVRWAGEKIVLEKYFGETYNTKYVQFALENQSVGALEPILASDRVDHGTVWTQVTNGWASAILTASDQGQANVVAGLYEAINGTALGNQHYFTVFFLKFESVEIGDVVGKRAQHNAGLWNASGPYPPNPWNTATDTKTQTLNVSQDALVRARVKGWFTNSNPSVRTVRTVDPANSTLNNPTSATLTLPAGRWILPDDWATLAGPNWKQSRLHWDIMNTVGGNAIPGPTSIVEFVGAPADYNANVGPGRKVVGNGELGDYYLYLTTASGTDFKYMPVPPNAPHTKYPIVGNDNVIGPFSPGLELMTPVGWCIVNAPNYDPVSRNNTHTVVPDGYLDWWDAPMPPAKVIYQIQDAGPNPNKNEVGYFKAVNKTDIYYVWAANTNWYPYLDDPLDPFDQYVKVYTNPFYQAMIPAHQAIPAFINNGGYDWSSFDAAYGAYIFWEFINQNRYLPLVESSDPSGRPTCVEVYSDNHGEAMVWVNGDWNVYFAGDPNYLNKSAVDAPYQATLGTTAIQATVDYPYSRLHQAFQSNTDVKTWLWGGLILGADEHLYGNGARSNGDATRMVISAGTWEGYPGGKIGTYPNEAARSKDKVVWVWVSDRDGLAAGVLNAKVVWTVSPATGTSVKISNKTANNPNQGISQYNEITKNIFLTNGFLTGTNGSVTDDPNRHNGISYLRSPTTVEKTLFNKFWGNGYTDPVTLISYNATSSINGLNPNNFVVAAIDLDDLTGSVNFGACNVTIDIYCSDFDPQFPHMALDKYVSYNTNVDFDAYDSLDDAIRPGDANYDGVVNMGDVTAVERMILGYTKVSQNAVLNSEGTVDMGTVVKIERAILGLK